jgi:hypothetical protein
MMEMAKCLQNLTGKSDGKRQLWRPRRRSNDSIVVYDLTEVGYADVDWIKLALDKVQRRIITSTVMDFQV